MQEHRKAFCVAAPGMWSDHTDARKCSQTTLVFPGVGEGPPEGVPATSRAHRAAIPPGFPNVTAGGKRGRCETRPMVTMKGVIGMQCLVCGREYVPSGHGKPQKYCSGACKTKAYKLRKAGKLPAEPRPGAERKQKPKAKPAVRVPVPETGGAADLSIAEFHRMMDESTEDTLRAIKNRLRKALDDADTPANSLPGISKALIDASERLDRVSGVDPLLGGLEGMEVGDDDGKIAI